MKRRLRRNDIIRKVHEDCGYYLYEVEDVFDSLLRVIRQELEAGNEVSFDKLFHVHIEKPLPREIFNGMSLETYMSPGYPRLRFIPSITYNKHLRKTFTGDCFKIKGQNATENSTPEEKE